MFLRRWFLTPFLTGILLAALCGRSDAKTLVDTDSSQTLTNKKVTATGASTARFFLGRYRPLARTM